MPVDVALSGGETCGKGGHQFEVGVLAVGNPKQRGVVRGDATM